ncbi:MAG: HPr kinase/phosphatase C-terminal domain-containing protein [Hyphomicrobium sp.]
MAASHERIHATAIAIDGPSGARCALIRGPSGAGKSDLALRCLALAPTPLLPYQAVLVADDQVVLQRRDTEITASAPPVLAGRLEIRGLGIMTLPVFMAEARAVLVVDLFTGGAMERMPDPWPSITLFGLELPLLRLDPREASAPVKLLAALASPTLPPHF